MRSIWKGSVQMPQFQALSGDTKTDVLIIGAGITGILCAHKLKEAGVDCIVLESNEICGGVTGNTTAKITYQHGAIFDKMIKRFGEDRTRQYLKAQNQAIEQYRKLSRRIDCDFKISDSYLYSLDNIEKIEKEVKALSRLGCNISFEEEIPLPFHVVGAARVKNQAQFNPLKLIFALAKDLKIYENTRVLEVTDKGALTNRGRVRADKIIVATHFPFINKYGGYFLKMYQNRSYVIALKNSQDVRGMYVDEADGGLSFRNYHDLLLLGGAGGRTGKSAGAWKELERFAKRHYPKSQVVYRWATQDCITLDDIPYIGRYSSKTPSLYVATGFNKWGMTSAMVSALILRDLVQGKDSEFEEVFSPSRSIIRPRLISNGAESIIGLLKPTAPRCPHLGCALKYNKYEHSWDCSCHGSRFSSDGKLLNNPATSDKKLK